MSKTKLLETGPSKILQNRRQALLSQRHGPCNRQTQSTAEPNEPPARLLSGHRFCKHTLAREAASCSLNDTSIIGRLLISNLPRYPAPLDSFACGHCWNQCESGPPVWRITLQRVHSSTKSYLRAVRIFYKHSLALEGSCLYCYVSS